ncbi:uncharacterized protein [Coffea arabica]|uniref:Uncharacterized protein n=1 Tax=Coffea arabica TaxID=13443 RepID=A0ABM4WPD3_COFAR
MPMKDRIYWVMSSIGVYTVKSGYKLAKIRKRKEEQRGTRAEHGCSMSWATLSWNSVWRMNMKPELQHFIWRCLNGILPVNALIMDRCSKGNFLCKCCGENPETIEHLFFFCNSAQEIWKTAPLDWDGLKNFRSKFWLWWEEMKDAVREEKGRERIELTVHLLWQIWKSRNGVQFNNKRREPVVAVSKAVLEWREYMEAQEEGDKAGWGLIARDWQGEVKGAWAVPSTSCSNAKVEEAKALRLAMLVAKQNGWRRVEFESDCLQVINDINSTNDEAVRCTVISDIRKLKYRFDECCFAFTKRENNSVSHTLARKALQMECPAEWKECFPGWLLELAHADCKGSCPFFSVSWIAYH